MQEQLGRYGSGAFIFLVFTLLLALFAALPRLGDGFFRKVEVFFSRLSSKRLAAVAVVFLATLGARLALVPVIGVPFPLGYDERSYLLMAEMFTHGHLAYPQHPLWKSFETFDENFYPAYSSMYPPAQGAALAVGDLLGHPWLGVLLSMAVMGGAIVWMLQAWLPARWAFLGGVIAFCNIGIASYWMNRYFGGAVAAIGGAMVLGALPRLRRLRVRDSLALGVGVAILANSRPYEGLLFCIPAAMWLLIWLKGKSAPPLGSTAVKVVLPAALVLCLTAAFMAYYNWRLTGNALLMPHALNFRTYDTSAMFLWQHAKPLIHYNNHQYELYYNVWDRGLYNGTWRDALHLTHRTLNSIAGFFLWPADLSSLYWLPLVSPPLLCLPLVFRDRRVRLFLIEFFFCLAGMLCVVYFWPHYAAPLTGVIFGLLVQAFRHMRVLRFRGRPVGLGLARASMILLLVGTCVGVVQWVVHPPRPCSKNWSLARKDLTTAPIEERLERIPGKHLVVVRYGPDHSPHGEWVHNHADIDASRIVWARELDPEQNAKLFAYYRDRHIWLIEPDVDPDKLLPYTPPAEPNGAFSAARKP